MNSYTKVKLLVGDDSAVVLKWLLYLLLIPIRPFYETYLNIRLAKVFGFGDLFTLFMIYLPFLTSLIIAFSNVAPGSADNEMRSGPVRDMRIYKNDIEDKDHSTPKPVPKKDWRIMDENDRKNDMIQRDIAPSSVSYDDEDEDDIYGDTPNQNNEMCGPVNVPAWDDDPDIGVTDDPPTPPAPTRKPERPEPMPSRSDQSSQEEASVRQKRTRKCPTCGGILASEDGQTYICSSCGKKFVIKKKG